MSLLKSGGLSGLLLVAFGSAAGGAYLYHRYRDSDWERREAEYQRQLQGHLTSREKEIEALNTQLGTARSQLVTSDELDAKYTALLTARDADFEKFRREHQLALKSISTSLFELKQRGENGMVEARVVSPPPSSSPGAGMAPDAKPVIAYAYADKDGRVRLTDPDIWVQGDEDLEMEQHFRVKGTVVQQQDGSLMAQRIQLVEVVPDGAAGQYRELVEARLVDANFTYANAPQQEPPSRRVKWGPGWMATVGTSFRSEHRLRFGASASVLRLGDVGLAGGLSSDFASLAGSGGDAFLTYTPSYRGRQLGVALGGGLHLPLGGTQRVRPNLTLNFVIY